MLKVLELFAGIGACSSALTRLGIEYEIIDAVEIDRFAIKSFNAIHGTNFEPQDITNWDKNIDVDLIMHGSPCQDFSVAGKQAGGDINSGTRSSLMYETIRIVGKLRPKYVVWENVKNLLSVKHKHNFDDYLNAMKSLGYTSYYQILNAKDYGVPQNRERVFTISIRKDIDNGFEFPPKQELKIRLKDILENEVDGKYYINNAQLERMIKTNYESGKFENRVRNEDSVAPTLCARDYKDPKCVQIGTLDMKGIDQIKRVYSPMGLSPTLTTMAGGNTEPKIIMEEIPQTVMIRKYKVDTQKLVQLLRKNKSELKISNKELTEILNIPITKVEHWFRQDDSFAIPGPDLWIQLKEVLKIETTEFDEAIMTFEEKENVYEKSNRCYHEQGICPTLTTSANEKIIIGNATQDKTFTVLKYDGSKIRKLTPRECWRLMGFTDEEFDKATKVNSNSQLYKQARKFHCCKCISGNI